MQKIELYRRFFPEATEDEAIEFVASNFAETMAEFKGLLVRQQRLHKVVVREGIGA